VKTWRDNGDNRTVTIVVCCSVSDDVRRAACGPLTFGRDDEGLFDPEYDELDSASDYFDLPYLERFVRNCERRFKFAVNKTTTSDVSRGKFDAELELLDAVCWWVRGDVLRADFGLEGEFVSDIVRAELPSPFYEDFGGEDPDYQNHPNLDKFLDRCYRQEGAG